MVHAAPSRSMTNRRSWGEMAGAASHTQRCAVFGAGGDLDDAVTQDRFNRCLTNPRPTCNRHTRLTVRAAASLASTNTVNTGVGSSIDAPSVP